MVLVTQILPLMEEDFINKLWKSYISCTLHHLGFHSDLHWKLSPPENREQMLTLRLCLFQDDIITVISRVDENWAEGKLGDQVGIFPILFVEVRKY